MSRASKALDPSGAVKPGAAVEPGLRQRPGVGQHLLVGALQPLPGVRLQSDLQLPEVLGHVITFRACIRDFIVYAMRAAQQGICLNHC